MNGGDINIAPQDEEQQELVRRKMKYEAIWLLVAAI